MDVSLLDRKYRIDEVCREFEKARYDAEPPSIQAFLERVPEEDRDETLCELIAIDMELRLEESGDVPVAEYLSQWPDLTDMIEQLRAEVIQQADNNDVTRTPFNNEAAHAGEFKGGPISELSQASSAPRRIGDFRIVREIGRGGMGHVYEAVQESLQRRVALKILPQSSWLRENGRERFQREARAIARLHHSNIVDVFGSGEHNGVSYFAMQLIDGQGLEKFIAACGNNTESQPIAEHSTADFSGATFIVDSESLDEATADSVLATTSSHSPVHSVDQPTAEVSAYQNSRSRSLLAAKIGREIAEALHYAHGSGVLHRDVKPSNILLDRQGTAWLTDFGLAKLVSGDHDGTLTEQGDILGTLRYMAPESLTGMADARSDVFGLGLVLLELITLRQSFGSGQRKELLHERLRGAAPAIGEFDSDVPRDLQTVIRKAVEVDPELRYQTAGELAADLNRVLNDEPINARHVSAVERLSRWARRNKLIAGLLLTTFTLLSIGLVAALLATEHFRTLEGEQRELVTEKTDLANEKGELADRNAALAEQNAKLANAAQSERDSVTLFASDVLAKQGLDAAEEQDELEALVLLAGSAAKSKELDEERYRANVLRSRRLIQKLPHPVLALPLKGWAIDMMLHPQSAAVLVKYAQTNSHQLFEQSSPDPTVLPELIGDDAALTWSADGRWLYAADKEKVTALRYPELDQPELIVDFLDPDQAPAAAQDHRDVVTQLACDPSGRFLAVSRGSVVQVWDIENHRFACEVIHHQAPVTHMTFSPDSAWFLTVDASQHFHAFETKLFTGPDAQSTAAFSGVHLQHNGVQEFRYPKFVNGGTGLIACIHGHGRLEHWYLESRQSETFSTPAGIQVTCVEPLGKNEYFVGGNDGGAIVSSATNGPVNIVRLDGMGIEVRTAAYDSVSQQLAIGYASRPSEIWSVQERSLTNRLSQGVADTTFMKYSPDGRQLMIAGARTYDGQAATRPSDIRVWEMPTHHYDLLTVQLGTTPHRAAFSSDSRFVAVRDQEGHVEVHDLEEGQQIAGTSRNLLGARDCVSSRSKTSGVCSQRRQRTIHSLY